MRKRSLGRSTATPGAIVLATLLTLAAVAVANFYAAIITGFSCAGTDASEPPEPGTVAAAACSSAPDTLHVVLALTSLVAPLVCAQIASARRSWRPLLLGIAISSAALLPLAIRTDLASTSEEIILPTLVMPIALVLTAAIVGVLASGSNARPTSG